MSPTTERQSCHLSTITIMGVLPSSWAWLHSPGTLQGLRSNHAPPLSFLCKAGLQWQSTDFWCKIEHSLAWQHLGGNIREYTRCWPEKFFRGLQVSWWRVKKVFGEYSPPHLSQTPKLSSVIHYYLLKKEDLIEKAEFTYYWNSPKLPHFLYLLEEKRLSRSFFLSLSLLSLSSAPRKERTEDRAIDIK